MERPIFFDASGRRNRWTMRTLFVLLAALVLASVVFAVTVVEVPVPRPLDFGMEHPQPRPLGEQVARIRDGLGRVHQQLSAWLPHRSHAANGETARPVATAFYVPWDDTSRASLVRHIGQIDWVMPGLLTVYGPDHRMSITHDAHFQAIVAASGHRPKILPVLQNARNGLWDGSGAAHMLQSRSARRRLLDDLTRYLVETRAQGVVFDLEDLPAAAQPAYRAFLAEAHARLAPHRLLLTVSVPVGDPDWNLRLYARIADRLFLMDYDEHYPSGTPGPIASQAWFVRQLEDDLRMVPPAKAIVAIGNYAYDWAGPGKGEPLSIEEAWLAAHDSAATIRLDPASGNATFGYEDGGKTHSVWMLDAASAWNQLRAVRARGVGGIALWRMGTEDPGFWPALGAVAGQRPPNLSILRGVSNADVEGNGEILRITATPTEGRRSVTAGPHGLITDERYLRLPTPYVVERTGYRPGLVALTFDDGPDPDWTPRILAILRREHVPATFFVVGENAMDHPFLLKAMLQEGDELGSHSFTHPNMAQVSGEGIRLELNATQRVIQAYTGRSARLFRAPYFGDAEPTTLDELVPTATAQQDGYVNVGLHVDPDDWKRPGVAHIVRQTLDQVARGSADRSAQIILLHDGGGDRSQTVAALPRIIDALRARGYRFVPVSELAGLSRDQVMPPVAGSDLLAVRADVALFAALATLNLALKWLFFLAIALGIGRALMMAGLALRNERLRRRMPPPPIRTGRFVSVLVPAYNEARVIEASVRRVLASTDVAVEVIVIDDGSTDETSALVSAAFADEERVRLLTLENGGKARALNRGLALARAEIVIALDADTQFEPETIARLARWFDDPAIGAVAGNAKVGNRVNLVTRWQAVEYVTAQNLERRALAGFDAIMVVPGAVGAWRRAAIDAAGGYPVNTLAEDQDLTIAIQRKGWAVDYDPDAVAWTEAPESFGALARQRFRWSYGTLQCLWKHRGLLADRRPAGLALVGMPQAWLFQILFALVSPLIDLALVVSIVSTALRVSQHGWDQTQSDVLRMGLYWLAFSGIDLLCGWVAYRLEKREKRFPGLLMLMQRFVYRQLMYYVVIRAVMNAVQGPWVGWGKLERSGRVAAPQEAQSGSAASA